MVALQPITRRLVEIFADIGFASHVLALHVFLEFGEIKGVGSPSGKTAGHIGVVINEIGHSCQRLTGGKGPYGTIPLALACAMSAE